jgi:hypothetical protein
MLPKILVTTGCSYGKFAEVFNQNFTKDIENLELVIDLHSISMGSNFQMISIIDTIDKMISIGVDTNDIFILAEFSEIHRKDIVIQNEFLVNQIEKSFKVEPINYPDRVIVKHTDFSKTILEKLIIKKIFPGDYPKFRNYYVINPEKEHLPKFPNEIIQSILDSYVGGLNIKSMDRRNIEFIDRAIQYFQNILTTELYLKSKGIKYKFCLINNQFSMFSENGLQTNKETKVIGGKHCLFQDYLNSKQIWEINSMINILYGMIDWSGWWFYKNEEKNIIWGGIDEFAIDKYGISAYSDRNDDQNLFGQHPTTQVYQDLIVNHLMKEYF